MAKIFKLSTHTLRYYDEINLLKPWKIEKNGYRYYSKAQFEMISTILLLRSIGTPISRLITVLEHENASLIEQELSNYTQEIDNKINALKNLKSQALMLQDSVKDTCYDNQITVKTIPKLWMLAKKFDTQENDELDINEIVNANDSAQENWNSFANIISTIDKKSLLAGDYHTYNQYGYISEQPCKTNRVDLLQVVESRLCVCCNAKVNRIDHLDIDEVYDKMLQYITYNNYRVVADAIERNVLDLYAGREKDLILFFKIYIPVEKI